MSKESVEEHQGGKINKEKEGKSSVNEQSKTRGSNASLASGSTSASALSRIREIAIKERRMEEKVEENKREKRA